MVVVYHLRNIGGDRVREAIEQQLRSERFVVATAEDLAEDESVPSWRRSRRKEIREISLYEQNRWVGIADDNHASTAWGPRLSRGFEVPVVKLAGECDHAFYSEAILFEKGLESATSNVPTDAVLEEDGRHRIRPTFLTVLAPEARQALERGVVVRELGGEENIQAVGAALGIPRPLVREFGEADVVDGVIVELSGPGLLLLDVETLEVYRPFALEEQRLSAKAEREGESLVFRFPDARLDRREDEEVPSASKPPPATESLRQNMRTSVWDMMGVDASSIKIGAYAPAQRAGEGELRIAVRTIEPPSLRVERITLSVREPLRVPVLPAWAKSPNEPDLASYAARDALVG